MATQATRATGDRQPAAPPPYLTVAEVAARWAVTTRTVQRLAGRGELTALRVGRALRIRPSDLEAYERRRSGTGAPA